MQISVSNLHEPQSFQPEYLPEVVGPYAIDKDVITRFSKQNWFRRFLGLPKVSKFVLESLEKSNEFSQDLYKSVKQIDVRVTNMDEKISTLKGMQGDFQVLMTKLSSIERNESEIFILRNQVQSLKRKCNLMVFLVIASVLMNAAVMYYTLSF